MPTSSSRKSVKSRKSSDAQKQQVNREDLPNPVWFKPVMFGFMLLGLAWILTFYISSAQLPLGAAFPAVDIKNWNILVGFGIAMVGFVMATRWK